MGIPGRSDRMRKRDGRCPQAVRKARLALSDAEWLEQNQKS